jgi:hypothetical protein
MMYQGHVGGFLVFPVVVVVFGVGVKAQCEIRINIIGQAS